MKKTIYFLLAVLPALLPSCSDDDKLPAVRPTESGTVVDNEGNTYGWVRIGDLLWTTSNANNGPDVWNVRYYSNFEWYYIFDGDEYDDNAIDYVDNYRPVYGNLMNYEDAVASAPEGWRLPTDEDWQKLERTLGMSDTDRIGKRGNGQAFRLQEDEEGTGLAMKLGGAFIFTPSYGWVDLPLDYQGVYGYYWTSTANPENIDEKSAYFRKFFVGRGEIWRLSGSTQQLMSVRWVRDAE